MTPTRHVTAVLLIAALIAAGCSKSGKTSEKKAESTSGGQTRPVATSGDATAVKPVGDAGTIGDAAVKVSEPATFSDGKAAYNAKDYTGATAIFERYADRRPQNAWGHYMLGLSAWKSGDAVKAEAAFSKALTIDRRHVKSYVNLSRMLIEQKRYDEALAQLTRAAEVDPSSIEVQRLIGRTYQDQGKAEEAMEAYHRAIELNELDAWSMNNLGLLLIEHQRAEEALPLLEKAVELRKNVPAFHNNLGMALEHAGRFQDAAAAYGNAVAIDPGYEKAKQNLERVKVIK